MSAIEPVNRRFYSLPKASEVEITPKSHQGKESENNKKSTKTSTLKIHDTPDSNLNQDLLSYIRNNVIGSHKTFAGPYGLRSVLYLDFVASGRAISFIEDYIRNEVLPEYGNTHTTTSITSLQTTLFRHEARDIVRNACNASEHDSVIFAGSGTTGAVHKLIHGLYLDKPAIVLTGPYEHHSNMLPWIETGAEVVRISEMDSGHVNLRELEECLKLLSNFKGYVFGAFSAASNVTGVLTNVNEVTALLHSYGAFAFWDYATAAPYVKIDMNPYVGGPSQHLIYKDAVYFSTHKFVGGVDCPGVLIAKKSLFQNSTPCEPGGGTVFYVRRDSHRYLQEPEMREEGGTPAIIGSIRAGLVFQLKEALGADLIQKQDDKLLRKAKASWSGINNLVFLGPSLDGADRLPVFSFLVYHPMTGRFLHHNFVAAVLNDVFGIQSRGGCACAGPYAMDLLGIKESVSEKLEQLLVENSKLDRIHLRRVGEYSHREFIRPGFVRINLPYFLDDESVDFVTEAISLTAEHAWKVLPQYLFNPETGEWRHKQFQTFKDRKWLGHISYASGQMSYHQPAQIVRGPLPASYQLKIKLPDQTVLFDDEVKPFRWFVLPSEAFDCLNNRYSQEPIKPSQLPFCPPPLLLCLGQTVPSLSKDSTVKRLKNILSQMKTYENNENRGDVNEFQVQLGHKNKPGKCGLADLSYSNDSSLSIDSFSQTVSFSDGMACALEQGFVRPESQDSEFQESREAESKCDKNYSMHAVSTAMMVNKNDVDALSQKVSLMTTAQSDIPESLVSVNETGSDIEPVALKAAMSSDIEQVRPELPPPASTDKQDILCVKGGVFDTQTSNTGHIKSSPKSSQGVRKKMSKWFSPPKSIFKLAVLAIEEYNMVQDGDRLLICLSGGKDSLSLLHTIRQYQFYARGKGINFEFGAVTIDPETPSYDPSPLKEYLLSLNVPYFYESQCIMETANNLPYECASICSFCSRMKRGRIYAAARREGYNVLALGQHLDDLSESFMMSYFHNGTLNTMKAHYTVKEGDLRVIRPFIYVRETDLRSFAEKNKLPIIAENCPACFEAPKERHRIKQLLAAQEVMFPQIYNSMLSAMKPLMARERQGGHNATRSKSVNQHGDTSQMDNEDDFDL